MGGSVLFQDALKARLDLIKPSRRAFDDCLRARPFKLSDGVYCIGAWVGVCMPTSHCRVSSPPFPRLTCNNNNNDNNK